MAFVFILFMAVNITFPLYVYASFVGERDEILNRELPAGWRDRSPSWRDIMSGDRTASLFAALILLVGFILTATPGVLLIKSGNSGHFAGDMLRFVIPVGSIACTLPDESWKQEKGRKALVVYVAYLALCVIIIMTVLSRPAGRVSGEAEVDMFYPDHSKKLLLEP